jgi:hypothetical protein
MSSIILIYTIRPAFLKDYMNFGNNDYLTKAKAITELILMKFEERHRVSFTSLTSFIRI